MVKSESRRDAEILVRNPSPRLFGKKFRDSKKVNTNHAKTRLRDLSKTLPRFRDPAKIFRDPRFSRYHSPPLTIQNAKTCRSLEVIAYKNRTTGVLFREEVQEIIYWMLFLSLYYYMRNFCNLIGLEQWYFSLI